MAGPQEQESGVVVLGARAHPLRDAYHSLLRMRWAGVLTAIAGAVLLLNVVFAAAYTAVGGVAGARPGSFEDAFFFSVQTMGTIGYGAMVPQSPAAHLLVTLESVVGLITTALATGIVFARFSQTSGMLRFTKYVCISPLDGVPTLQLRVGNDRASTIFEAQVRVVLIRTEKTREGVVLYRMYDLDLVRDRSPALQRSWTVMHRITEKSPLFDATPSSCKLDEVEIAVSVVGTDDISLQPVHARRLYLTEEVRWGARPADILRERPDGLIELDVRRFDDVVATEATPEFPYPAKSAAG